MFQATRVVSPSSVAQPATPRGLRAVFAPVALLHGHIGQRTLRGHLPRRIIALLRQLGRPLQTQLRLIIITDEQLILPRDQPRPRLPQRRRRAIRTGA